jgi:hypothetical protein
MRLHGQSSTFVCPRRCAVVSQFEMQFRIHTQVAACDFSVPDTVGALWAAAMGL